MVYKLNTFHIGSIADIRPSLSHFLNFPASENVVYSIQVDEAISVWYIDRTTSVFKEFFPAMTKLSIKTEEKSLASIVASGFSLDFILFEKKLRQLEGSDFDLVWVDRDRQMLVWESSPTSGHCNSSTFWIGTMEAMMPGQR